MQKAVVVDRGCAEVLLSSKIIGRIRGHANFADGTPAANVNLALENALANPRDYSARNPQHRTSAADGSFEFSRLDPEVYLLGTNVDSPAFGPPYSMWEPSGAVNPQVIDASGKVTVLLRKGAYYDIGAYASTRGGRQTCAEPAGVLAADDLKPITLTATHPFGSCRQFKKPR
jgi:hypothetical protein